MLKYILKLGYFKTLSKASRWSGVGLVWPGNLWTATKTVFHLLPLLHLLLLLLPHLLLLLHTADTQKPNYARLCRWIKLLKLIWRAILIFISLTWLWFGKQEEHLVRAFCRQLCLTTNLAKVTLPNLITPPVFDFVSYQSDGGNFTLSSGWWFQKP